jgi:hypothetical protein
MAGRLNLNMSLPVCAIAPTCCCDLQARFTVRKRLSAAPADPSAHGPDWAPPHPHGHAQNIRGGSLFLGNRAAKKGFERLR